MLLQSFKEQVMIQIIKEPFDIQIHYPGLIKTSETAFVYRIVRTLVWPVTIAVVMENLFQFRL